MEETWTTGLYSCGADSLQSCDTVFCCCCELSRQFKATEGISDEYDALALVASPMLFLCMYATLRRRVVRKYHIGEDLLTTVITVLCCGACSTCQVHRELTARNVWPGSTLKCFSSVPLDYGKLYSEFFSPL